jgi:aminoglycoside 6'-N-acetyltransferase I
MKIISPSPENTHLIEQAAHLLVDAFREHWPDAWPTLEEGLKEVHEMLESERICRVAVDEKWNLLGIIGGIPGYDGHVWELHPLAVQPSTQGQGIGRALVEDFEEQVRLKGALTITLGSDDENGMTSLANVDLYEDLWEKIRDIQNLKHHPFEFYQKMGYVITGIVPDANGVGKPDILMAKKVGR